MGQTQHLFYLFSSLSQYNKYSTIDYNRKNQRWCAWNSNPGPHYGRYRRIHWGPLDGIFVHPLWVEGTQCYKQTLQKRPTLKTLLGLRKRWQPPTTFFFWRFKYFWVVSRRMWTMEESFDRFDNNNNNFVQTTKTTFQFHFQQLKKKKKKMGCEILVEISPLSEWEMKAVLAQMVRWWCVYDKHPKITQHLKGNIPNRFDCWANPVVQELL